MRWIIDVPASSANLGPGFDVLGLALQLYLTVEVETADQWRVSCRGEGAAELPLDEDNLIIAAAKQMYRQLDSDSQPLSLACQNDIPLARGLGSSSSAVIAGCLAAAAASGEMPRDPRVMAAIQRVVLDMEGHLDNAMASLCGGLAMSVVSGSDVQAYELRLSPVWKPLALVPAEHLATAAARRVLPAQVALQDGVTQAARVSLLVESLARGDVATARTACEDLYHQPYRRKVYPLVDQLLTLAAAFPVPFWLSGAGPSVMMLLTPGQDGMAGNIREQLASRLPSVRLLELAIDRRGAQVTTAYHPLSS